MEIFNYIFFLGIIFIVFSIIWFFIALLPKFVLGNNDNSAQNAILNYIIKAAQFYFLASLTAIKAIDFIKKENIDPKARATIHYRWRNCFVLIPSGQT